MQRPIDWLNYQHLLYFWMVAKHGTVGEAARRLHLTSPTVSLQIRKLETACGHELLVPRGRGLELTDAGQLAFDYANQIFGLGAELSEALSGQLAEGSLRLRVGIVDAVPKLIVHRLLTPLLQMRAQVQLSCREGLHADLVDQVASHQLDVVISDSEGSSASGRKVFNHPLGESSITLFAAKSLVGQDSPSDVTGQMAGEEPLPAEGATAEGDATRPTERSPRLLQQQQERERLRAYLSHYPILLPGPNSAIRRQLDALFEREKLQPRVAHEFSDTALMKVFGEAGAGMFPAPTLIEARVRQQYRVQVLTRLSEIREELVAITAERQIRHPAVELLTETGRELWSQAHAEEGA